MNVCVLIPAHNEEIVIQETLNSLYHVGFKPNHIYVIDDCSQDLTNEICTNNGINVLKTYNNLGKAGAQKEAIDRFGLCDRYHYVIMMDADTKVDENFRDVVMMNVLAHPNTDLFVGRVTSSKNDHIYSAYRAIEYSFSHEVIKKAQNKFKLIYVAPGCVSIYATRMLRRLVFDASILAEDMDLTIQVQRLSGKIKYIHDAKVITQDPSNIGDYNKQLLRWYRGFWQVVLKYKNEPITKIDLYIMYLMIDSLLLNRFALLTIMLIAAKLPLVLMAICFDLVIFIIISVYASYETKRIDLIYKSPVIYFLSLFNTYAYLRSFFEVVLLRRKNFGWNKVKRYGD